MLGWNEQSDFWQVKTFIQENTGRQDNYRSLESTPVFKYKYVDRQLQIYVSFDARQCRSYTSFTARVTSDNPADVSTPGADALVASGTVGTAEVGICYGVGTNAANVGIGTTNPGAKLDVNGTSKIGSNGTVIKNQVFKRVLIGSSTSNPYKYGVTFTYGFTASSTSKLVIIANPMNAADYNDTFVITINNITTSGAELNTVRVDNTSSGWGQSLVAGVQIIELA
jgi:hypothetical protein